MSYLVEQNILCDLLKLSLTTRRFVCFRQTYLHHVVGYLFFQLEEDVGSLYFFSLLLTCTICIMYICICEKVLVSHNKIEFAENPCIIS